MTTKAGRALEYIDMGLDSMQLFDTLPKLYNKYIVGKSTTEEDKQKLVEMIRAGKTAEALEETINSWTTGLSSADEMRLLRDVCHLISGKQITAEEGYTFFSFLENGGPDMRTRFREAYITDKDPIMRWGVIVILSKLASDDHRKTFLIGDGLMDPTLSEVVSEQIWEAVQVPLDSLAEFARERLPELEFKHSVRVLKKLEAKIKKSRKPADGSWFAAFWDSVTFKIF